MTKDVDGILLYLQVGGRLGQGDRGTPRGTSSSREALGGQREVPAVVGVCVEPQSRLSAACG